MKYKRFSTVDKIYEEMQWENSLPKRKKEIAQLKNLLLFKKKGSDGSPSFDR